MIYKLLFGLIIIILILILIYLLSTNYTTEGFEFDNPLMTEDEFNRASKFDIDNNIDNIVNEIRDMITDDPDTMSNVYTYNNDIYILTDTDTRKEFQSVESDTYNRIIFDPLIPEVSIELINLILTNEKGIFNSSTTQEPTDTTQEPTDTTQEPTDTTQEPTDTTQEPTDTTQEPTDTTQEPTDTTTSLNAYNEVINKLDVLIANDKKSEIPTDLKIDILELPQTQRASLCEDYCEVYSGTCSPLCNFLGCDSCNPSSTPDPEYRQPGELSQNQVPRTQDNTHIDPNPMNLTQTGNGESNIFAPYVVVHKKKPGESYNAYVMSNPHDPNYYNYINNLS
jgi:uncharacterized protein (UPF0333 family)